MKRDRSQLRELRVRAWRTSRKCWQRFVAMTDSPNNSASCKFMKKLVRHQSPQYITFCATPASLKQSLPKIRAKPLRIAQRRDFEEPGPPTSIETHNRSTRG